jgi:hypothetical protein
MMAAEEQPPTDWIPGPDIAAVFRRGHAERMRAYMTGATAQLYQRAGELALPYHYDVLAVARQFLDADKDDVAVIMAQTACEIATDDIIRTLLQHYRLPSLLESWIHASIERITTLKTPMLYDLYRALSGDDLKQPPKALWDSYLRRAKLRNDIVHSGAHASKDQAAEACDSALDLIHHFVGVRAGSTDPMG